MSSDNIKKRVNEKRKTSDAEIIKRIANSPRMMAYLGTIAVVVISGVAGLAYLRDQTEKHAALQNEKDKQTDMTLIGMEKNVTGRGYAGLMFFSKSGQTNRADAVMHYATIDPNVMENVRHLKLGDKKKVAEWKGLVEQKYIKSYSWYELTKE